jgi:hypothetical protein
LGFRLYASKLPDENADAGDEPAFHGNDDSGCDCNDGDRHDDYACNAHAHDNNDHGDDVMRTLAVMMAG